MAGPANDSSTPENKLKKEPLSTIRRRRAAMNRLEGVETIDLAKAELYWGHCSRTGPVCVEVMTKEFLREIVSQERLTIHEGIPLYAAV